MSYEPVSSKTINKKRGSTKWNTSQFLDSKTIKTAPRPPQRKKTSKTRHIRKPFLLYHELCFAANYRALRYTLHWIRNVYNLSDKMSLLSSSVVVDKSKNADWHGVCYIKHAKNNSQRVYLRELMICANENMPRKHTHDLRSVSIGGFTWPNLYSLDNNFLFNTAILLADGNGPFHIKSDPNPKMRG